MSLTEKTIHSTFREQCWVSICKVFANRCRNNSVGRTQQARERGQRGPAPAGDASHASGMLEHTGAASMGRGSGEPSPRAGTLVPQPASPSLLVPIAGGQAPLPEVARREFAEVTARKTATSLRQTYAGTKRAQDEAIASAPPSVASTVSRLRIAQLEEELASFRATEVERDRAHRRHLESLQERERQWQDSLAQADVRVRETVREAHRRAAEEERAREEAVDTALMAQETAEQYRTSARLI